MKIIMHLLNTGSYSGAENVAIKIIENTSEKFESVYVSLDGTIRDILKQKNIRFFPVQKLSYKCIKSAIKILKPDIIHAHDFTAGIISSVVAGEIPVINHLHNNSPWIKHLSFKSIVYAISCLHYKKILTVSSSVIDEYIFGRFLRKKVLVIGNPIDISKIQNQVLDDTVKPFDVIFLGRLSKQKNPLFFLEIIDKLRKDIPSVKAIMVGNGELYDEIEKEISERSLSQNVSLVGFQKNPYSYIAKCKVMCMPSLWEGYGLAAVECLAFGKPVIASPVGGLPTFIDSTCGKLVATKEGFVKEIEQCLTNRKYYCKKSLGAFAKIKILDNIDEYTTQILDIYEKLIDNSKNI